MRDMAQEYGLYVAGSTLERADECVFNTAALYSPEGVLLGSYRKIHRFRLMEEHIYLTSGDRAVLCPTPWGAVGLAICYDLRFPELFRTLALADAVLFLVPAQWPVRRVDAWSLLARARAVENELFVAACNRVGRTGDAVFPGCSAIIDPWGHALAEGTDEEGLIVATAHLAEIRRARRYLTVYQDRQPEAYRIQDE